MSKPDRSMDCRDEHLENIAYIDVTIDVSKPDRSRDCRDEQLWNIAYIDVTIDVSKPDRSRDCRDEQLWNIFAIVVTLRVSALDRSILVILDADSSPSVLMLPQKYAHALWLLALNTRLSPSIRIVTLLPVYSIITGVVK